MNYNNLEIDPLQEEAQEGGKVKSKNKPFTFGNIKPELLTAVYSGDQEAFDKLYLMCINPLIDFLDLILHSRDDAEELSQDIFLKLWKERSARKIDNFPAYLYKMARSAAFNHLQHNKVVEKYKNFAQNYNYEYENSPDEVLIGNELALMIELSLNNMPEQRKRVFEMSRYEGLSNKEIAAKLNISTDTVRVHIHNVTKELEKIISLSLLFLVSQ